MSHAPGCPHRELAVGWALHCLEPAEEESFAAHLPLCGDCRRTVGEAEEVGVALALAAPDAAPPVDLAQRVLNATIATSTSASAPVVPLRPRRERPERRRLGRVLTTAAAITLVAVSVGLGARVMQLDSERDQFAGPISLLDPDGTPLAVLLAGPEQLTLVPVDLPANRVENQEYVLWGLGSGAPVALDAFDVAADAPIVHTVGSVPHAEAFTAYAVSLEPGHTPPAAPSDVMARGQVAS
jgi:anti-sigma-K factor RskA